MKTLFTPNTLKKLTLVLILLGIITGGAYASKFGGGQCTYVLNVKNSIGTVGSDAPGIIISNAKVHYLDFTQWKSTDAGSGTTGELSAGYTKTMTTTISYDLGKYSYKFSFDWKCSDEGETQSYTTDMRDYPFSGDGTVTVQIDSCYNDPFEH